MQIDNSLRGKVLDCLELSLKFSTGLLCIFYSDLRDQRLSAISFFCIITKR
jgi:hypothetical protein